MQKPDLPRGDTRIGDLRRALGTLQDGLPPVPEVPEDTTHAAVSLVLRQGRDLELLLIRRAEAEGDPWSGQMALPGGRRDPADPSLLHTAIRETEEEVSLSLQRHGTSIGRLQPTAPATTRLPPITIFPFVFEVPMGTEAHASSREVDEVLWVPLGILQNPESSSTVEIHYGENQSRIFPCWRLGERVIWGLTYRILTGLFDILPRSP